MWACHIVTVLRQPDNWSGKRDSNPRPSAWKADALSQLSYSRINRFVGPIPKSYEFFFVDSGNPILAVATVNNLLRQTVLLFSGKSFLVVEGGGFEPPKSTTSDLQSDPFGHSGTPPGDIYYSVLWGAWLPDNSMELARGIEPPTSSLQVRCSTS
jgi:hypothetical protein